MTRELSDAKNERDMSCRVRWLLVATLCNSLRLPAMDRIASSIDADEAQETSVKEPGQS
jgi:hypothetical protein